MSQDEIDQKNDLPGLDYWRLCDELSIVQAALLIAGSDPSSAQSYVENWEPHLKPPGYEAAKAAISNSLDKGEIKGFLTPMFDSDIQGNRTTPNEGSINIHESKVEVDSLRNWLARRGVRKGFFFPTENDAPDYLDPKNLRFAPKLAAAVRAWQAVTDPGKKSAKQALEKWLNEHAAEFGLVDDDGKPIKQAVEDCSKVANWNQTGGAPKTPSA